MSACVESNGSDPQIGSNSDIKTSNIVVTNFDKNANHYRRYNNEVTITGLPALQTLSTLNCSDIGIDVNSYESSAKVRCPVSLKNLQTPALSMPSSASKSTFIQIPFGWKRELVNGHVVYYTPTNVCIESRDELSTYLQTEGTDKTGLECPLHIDMAFSFDVSVVSKPYDIGVAKLSKQFCNQKQRIIALATYRQLIAEQHDSNRVINKPQIDGRTQVSATETVGKHNVKTGDNKTEYSGNAQVSDCINVSYSESHDPNVTKFYNQPSVASISVVQTNQNFYKCGQSVGITGTDIDSKYRNPLPQNTNHVSNSAEKPVFAEHHHYLRQASNENNHCQYSVPIGTDPFCIYDQSVNGGVYSVSACDSGQIAVQSNEAKTSIYLAPQSTANYGHVISYENSNLNLIQSSHPQVISAEDYHHYSHAFHPSESLCNQSLSSIPSYIPIGSANANSGAISFNANALPPNAITLNPTYQHQDTSHCHSQNNISILPANSPMPPISVPNVTRVSTSVTDVIPTVGIGPQIINSTNTSGAPQVLQFINSVPLTQITANTVTVLQQSPAQEVSVPATTLIIPQLMPSHEHQVVINHAMAPQTAVFPHIATATGLTALTNAFPSAINITNAIAMPQRTAKETFKPSRSRRRKEYARTNRTHPPTVASILKRADNEKKQKELNDKQKVKQKDQELQTISDINESNCELSPDSHQKESISVAVQSEIAVDSDTFW